jgi:signal transduction histidine kinase
VSVIDDGPGVAAEDRERIFEAYQRARQAPGLPGSVGLGLSVSRQLALLMEGDLTYRHEAGESIFELSLPKPRGISA